MRDSVRCLLTESPFVLFHECQRQQRFFPPADRHVGPEGCSDKVVDVVDGR